MVNATDALGVPELGLGSWLLVSFMAFLSALTIGGNLIVLLSYYLDKNIRQPSNYFIFSLAISDLVIGLEGFPVYTYFFIRDQHWPFGAFLCDFWLSIDYSCCLASIYTVLGITIDRYCSVKYPAAYRNWRTQTRILLIIAITWIVPSLLFSVSIFGYSLFSGKGRILRDDECYVQFMTNAFLNMGMYVAYYWSTLFLMLYLYFGIYKAAKQLAVKSDQKQKRLALLSEMRKNTKDNQSIVAVSEANLSNSAAESQPDTSDSIYSRNNVVNAMNPTGNGRVVRSSILESQSIDRSIDHWNKSFDQGDRSIDRSFSKSFDKSETLDKWNKSFDKSFDKSETFDRDRSELTEKSVDRAEISERSMDFEPSITISIQPIEPEEVSFAFSIDDEIPFIDEDSLTSLSKSIRVEKTAIPLKRSFLAVPPGPPSNTPAPFSSSAPTPAHFSIIRPTPIMIIEAEPISLQPERTTEPLQFLNHRSLSTSRISKKTSTLNHNNANSQSRHRSKSGAVDRPTLTASDTPPGSTTNTYASLSVVVEKSANGPMSMRRLLTVMRYQIKTRKLTPSSKSVHSRSENRARKALRTITFILGSFTILWTPFYVLATIYGFCERCKNSYEFNLLYTISYYLCYMNSPLNPICYAFANQQFKRAFKRILRGDFRRI
ncbi:Muscarinic acetylcholine receptor gar-2 [Aphelenchoides bicaudatus]|nr:Muscarinic acetylcholine receptor gar-2 [Aphelenchoides bicaudatus]